MTVQDIIRIRSAARHFLALTHAYQGLSVDEEITLETPPAIVSSDASRLERVISRKIWGRTTVRTREITQGFSGSERQGKTEAVNAWMAASGEWLPIMGKTHKKLLVGWVRK